MSWTADSEVVSHDIYLGTNAASVANANHSSPEFKGNTTSISYTYPGEFIEGQTYYWRVDGVNAPNVWKGQVWSFVVVSYPAINPNPANLQRKVTLNASLSWTGNLTANQHDVYLGTDATLVANATHASPEFKGTRSSTTYTNAGGFIAGQAYYWRIDEIDSVNNKMVKGGVWKFATERNTPIILTKGIVFDRQYAAIPPEINNTIDSYDVALVKHMGFNFAKVLFNPAPMISGNTINVTNMAYVEELVNRFLDQGVPVVVCIHPEPAFKTTYLGSASGFTNLLGFYHDFAAYLAARWGQNEVVFQLMTEPFGNYTDWNTMLPQMVQSVRSAMPNNTLIIGGAESGRISGLTAISQACINTINDNNVYYGFTYWDESNLLPFMFQGGGIGLGPYFAYLKNVPYPSSTSNNPADYILSTCPSGQYDAALNAVKAYCDSNWDMSKQQSVLQPIVNWNNSHGGNLKLICYEMGVPIDPCQATAGGGIDPSDRIEYIHDKRVALEEKNIGWTYWSFNETFTVLNYPLRVAFEKGVTKRLVSSDTLSALGLPCGCGCINDNYPMGDINSDCYVDFSDFAIIAGSWMDCTEPTDPACQ
ncbi:MAG: cellulase family glycosylhydrolase [Phycisphaerales bacterium]